MMFAPGYTAWHCGTLKKERREMSNTPKTDKLFFPFGRDHTAAASPSFLTCMTEYELLEMENAALREQLKDCSDVVDRQQKMLDRNAEQIAVLCNLLSEAEAKKPWVGLTNEEKDVITGKVIGFNSCVGWEDNYAKAIEAKLKEKNG